MRDIDERLGVSVGMILSHLNRDHAPVQSAVAFIESHLVDAWFYTDIGSGQRRMRIPPVALPTFSLDAAADGEGNVDFYLLHVRHGDYHILLTCCEVDLRAWHLLADGASAPNSIEMQVLRTQYCPVYRCASYSMSSWRLATSHADSICASWSLVIVFYPVYSLQSWPYSALLEVFRYSL